MTEPQSIDEAWQRLTTHIAWSDAFWLVYLFTDDPRVNDELRDRVKTQLLPVGREVIHLRPSGDKDDTSVLERLLAGQEGAVAWVDVVRHDQPGETKWRDAWELLCAQLNMRRELLKRRWAGGGIVLATTLDRLDRSAGAAPDLWTIRALLLRVATLPAEPGDGRDVRLLDDERDEDGPTGDPELARQAVARARKRGDQLALLETLVGLAEATEGGEAKAAADEGRAIGDELLANADRSTQLKIAGWWTRLGRRVLVRLGARDEARACFEQSIELFEQVHGTRMRPEIADALLGLAWTVVDANEAKTHSVEIQQQALAMTTEAVLIRVFGRICGCQTPRLLGCWRM